MLPDFALEEFPSFEAYMAEMIELIELCPYKQLQARAWHFLAFSLPDAVQAADALARSVMLGAGCP